MREVDAAALTGVLRRLFGLPEDAEAVLAARVKHMQILGFPARRRVGRGYRRSYGVGEIVRLAVAFQLVDAGLSSALAVDLVDRHWCTLGPLLAQAAAGGRRVPLVAFTPNVLPQISRSAAERWRGGRCVAVGRSSRPPAGVRGAAPAPCLLVDPGHLVDEVARSLRALEGVAGDEVAQALRAFAQQTPDAEAAMAPGP